MYRMAHNQRFNNQDDKKYDEVATRQLMRDIGMISPRRVIELIRKGANPHVLDQETTLYDNDGDLYHRGHRLDDFARSGDADFLQELFQYGVTPHLSIIMTALRHAGKEISARDRLSNEKVIAVIDAVLNEDPSIINQLTDFNGSVLGGLSALIYAVRAEVSNEIIEHLLECGANIDLQDEHRRTALMHAAESGNKRMIDLLLRHGAESQLTSKRGLIAHNYANKPYPKRKLPNRQGGKRNKRKTRRGKSSKSSKSRKTRRHYFAF